MYAPAVPDSRLFPWAQGAAALTLGLNVLLYVAVVGLAPSQAEVMAHPDAFESNAVAAMLIVPLTGIACLIAVVLTMEYRTRSAPGPLRRKRVRLLSLLLLPTLLHALALVVLAGMSVKG